MRINIIIHSISGNLYIIAKSFQEALKARGANAKIYRVEDSDLHIEANSRTEVNEYYEEIMALPSAKNEALLKADVIMIGTVSIFAMPSAEMKLFLDGTLPLAQSKALSGKKFFGFASSEEGKEDGMSAVKCLYHWARRQSLEFVTYEPYIHMTGRLMPKRPSENIDIIAEGLAEAMLYGV